MCSKQIAAVTKQIKKYAADTLSSGRFEHSLRTAKLCRKLCERFLLDGQLGFLAGLSHDLCKGCPDEELLALAAKDGFPVSALEAGKPSLLHGRAAAVRIAERFGVDNPDVLDAVSWHTFGRKGLCPVGRALFIADKIEPGRKGISKTMRKETLALDFDEMTVRVIRDNIIWLGKTGKIVAPETLAMLRDIEDSLAHRTAGRQTGEAG